MLQGERKCSSPKTDDQGEPSFQGMNCVSVVDLKSGKASGMGSGEMSRVNGLVDNVDLPKP